MRRAAGPLRSDAGNLVVSKRMRAILGAASSVTTCSGGKGCSRSSDSGNGGCDVASAASIGKESMVCAVEKEAQQIEMGFEVCNVKRALASVARICERGNRVVFDEGNGGEGSFIENKKTGNRIKMRRKGNAWVVDVNMVGTGHAEEIYVDSAAEESVCPKDFGEEFGLSKAETEVRLVNASGGKIQHLGGRHI